MRARRRHRPHVGFSEATSQAIRALDEHWDGQGQPCRLGREGLEGLEGQEEQEGQEGLEGQEDWRGRRIGGVASGFSRKTMPAALFRLKGGSHTAQSKQRAQRLIQRRDRRDRKGPIICSACFAGSAFDPSSASSAASAIKHLRVLHASTLECFSRPATLERDSTYTGVNVTV
jgi:hypothetical protein